MRRMLIWCVCAVLAGCNSATQIGSDTVPGMGRAASRVVTPRSCTLAGPLIWVGGGSAGKSLNGWDNCSNKEWSIHGTATGIAFVEQISADPTTGNIYQTANSDSYPGANIFKPGQNGNATPYEVLDTDLIQSRVALHVDPSGYVFMGGGFCPSGSCHSESIYRFNPGDHGTNVTPEHTITPNVDTDDIRAITDDGNGHLWVITGDSFDTLGIMELNSNANGSTSPLLRIHGSNVILNQPLAIAIDPGGDIYVADELGNNFCSSPPCPGKIKIWNSGDSGNHAPDHSIAGSNTGINFPTGVAISGSSDSNAIYVSDQTSGILKFASGSTGNATPLLTIPTMDAPTTLALCPTDLAFGPSPIEECASAPSMYSHKRTKQRG